MSTRNFFYFAFTFRYFFSKESGPAKFETDVLTT
jgi:CDP-diacylglycerol pyrophosphatase